MSFFRSGETVENPCKDVLAHPLQCFQELFFATPAIVGTLFVGIGGLIVAAIIWGAIFGLCLYALIYMLKKLHALGHYVFTQTKAGQKIASYVPVSKYLNRICQKANGVQTQKLVSSTSSIGEYGANIVSKVHVDTKWFKNAFKFGSKNECHNNAKQQTPQKSPNKSSNTSKLAALTPKILTPKSIKQS